MLHVTLVGAIPLSGSNKPLVLIDATVLNGAPYEASEVLQLTNVQIGTNSSGIVPSIGDSAVHKDVYLGDADGDGQYLSNDAGLINRTVPLLNLDSGYDAEDWTDPVIIGDIDGTKDISALDAAYVLQKAVGLPRPEIPNILIPPGSLVHAAAGLDPTIRIPDNILTTPGATLNVPVDFDIEPGVNMIGATFTVTYDHSVLHYQQLSADAGPDGSGWSVLGFENPDGTITVGMFSTGQQGPATNLNLATLTFDVVATGNATSPMTVTKVGDNEGGLTWHTDSGSVIVDATPPTVTAMRVGSTAWSSDFKKVADATSLDIGYVIPGGATQLAALPWTNVNQIMATFSENVTVAIGDLKLHGVNTADYSSLITGFSYDPTTFTATWTLNTSGLTVDKYLAVIDTTVKDTAGNALDGEWTNGGDSYPSGNGSPGGKLQFQFNLLPGDANQSGVVLGSDVGEIRLNRGPVNYRRHSIRDLFDLR